MKNRGGNGNGPQSCCSAHAATLHLFIVQQIDATCAATILFAHQPSIHVDNVAIILNNRTSASLVDNPNRWSRITHQELSASQLAAIKWVIAIGISRSNDRRRKQLKISISQTRSQRDTCCGWSGRVVSLTMRELSTPHSCAPVP
jgi:hypothetical protein